MLLPQFTLRWLLAFLTASAAISLIFSLALRGRHWAVAISISIVSLLAILLVQALVFCLVWLCGVAAGALGDARRAYADGRHQDAANEA
jgi:hypothetical protein